MTRLRDGNSDMSQSKEDRRVTQAKQRSDPKDRMTLLLAYLTSGHCYCGRVTHEVCALTAARLMQRAWSEINGKVGDGA